MALILRYGDGRSRRLFRGRLLVLCPEGTERHQPVDVHMTQLFHNLLLLVHGMSQLFLLSVLYPPLQHLLFPVPLLVYFVVEILIFPLFVVQMTSCRCPRSCSCGHNSGRLFAVGTRRRCDNAHLLVTHGFLVLQASRDSSGSWWWSNRLMRSCQCQGFRCSFGLGLGERLGQNLHLALLFVLLELSN